MIRGSYTMQELTYLRSLEYSTQYHSPTWTCDGISLIVMPAEESVQKREKRPRALGRLKSFMVAES